jgi:hypothetical protein
MEKTTYFDLNVPAESDSAAIGKVSENFPIIDAEMHKPPLTVNQIEPDPETRNLQITTVPLADNLTSDSAQIATGTFIIRTSGGEASLTDGPAMITSIIGHMVKSGYVAESADMVITPAAREEEQDTITATINKAAFLQAVSSNSGTMLFTFATSWDTDPASYGITVEGTPIAGDEITVTYNKGNRGTIATANPSAFVSTGWNLYNHTAGYAKVCDYSDEYGYMIDGSYTSLAFAETIGGSRTPITPINGYFTVPSNGYVFVEGGNATDTAIWTTWSDWTEQPNGGVFEPYSQTSIDLSGIMVNFPNGLMRVGNIFDEINFNTGKAYSRVQRLEYNQTNLDNVISLGLAYDTDTGYIYAAKQTADSFDITISGAYTVNGHGTEFFNGTSVAVTVSSLYGQDLKDKLKRNVLTISQQTLTDSQKQQVRQNIGAAQESVLAELLEKLTAPIIKKVYTATVKVPANGTANVTGDMLKMETPTGYEPFAFAEIRSSSHLFTFSRMNALSVGSDIVLTLHNLSTERNATVIITVSYIKSDFLGGD